jgi:hypothetical protein
MASKIKRVVDGPANLGGMLGRIVELEDGSGRVETWRRPSEGWVPGGADGAEIMGAPPALPQRLIEYGVPEEDWPPDMLEDWRREQRSKQA